MKIILSPAKSMNFEIDTILKDSTTPQFIERSEYLVKKLQKYSHSKLKKMMSVSDDITALNVNRYHNWKFPFDSTARNALFVFTGEAYRGLDAQTFTEKEIAIANSKLRILSGLYGLLKPTDLMLPYRLEMGTRMIVTPKTTNLYKYWGTQLTDALNLEMEESEVLVNLASNEYSKAIDFKKLKASVITCHFKEYKNGEYKTIMTFAKRARGTMSRFIIRNDITDKSDLLLFNEDRYEYNASLSTKSEFTFTR